MSRHRFHLRNRAAIGELPPDLYVGPGPWRRTGRLVDDWPARVPVANAEIDVFEAWFGDLFDELFGPFR
jgi:hypothetical protein